MSSAGPVVDVVVLVGGSDVRVGNGVAVRVAPRAAAVVVAGRGVGLLVAAARPSVRLGVGRVVGTLLDVGPAAEVAAVVVDRVAGVAVCVGAGAGRS